MENGARLKPQQSESFYILIVVLTSFIFTALVTAATSSPASYENNTTWLFVRIMVIYQCWFNAEECATDREGCVIIDVKCKIDVPDGAICINEQRLEIKIVDDDCFEPAIDSPVTNHRSFFVYKK